jgi:hypothetical protein
MAYRNTQRRRILSRLTPPLRERGFVAREVGGGERRRALPAEVQAKGVPTRVHDCRDGAGGRGLAFSRVEKRGVVGFVDVQDGYPSASILDRIDGRGRGRRTCGGCGRARGGGRRSAGGSGERSERRDFAADVVAAPHWHSEGLERKVSRSAGQHAVMRNEPS